MPFNLPEKPCQVCGKPMNRLKYCKPCAKIKKNELIKEIYHSHDSKGENKSEEEKSFKGFAWDNPNDPSTG